MMRKLLIAITLVLPMAASALSFTQANGVNYSQNTDEYSRSRCKLDVYYPTDAKNLPVVVWFHGGGLTGGEKFIPNELKDKGVVVVGVNYRLLPKATLQECIDDAAAAVAWAFKNISKYGGSPSKIYVSGHSAGGYLTSMIGLDKQYLLKYGIDADSIKALIPFSGQSITPFAQRQIKGMSPKQPLVDEMAPLFHVRPDAPPVVLITGDRNRELYGRYEETAYLWRMLKEVGHKAVYLYELDGYDHGSMASPAFPILLDHLRAIEAGK